MATLKKQVETLTLENIKLREEMINMKGRALKVHEDNELLKLAPDLAIKKAEMQYQLSMAEQFVASKAFPKSMSPEQCFTVMKAGAEMGLKEVESLQTLYIVNGAVKPYGDGMISMIRKKGYIIEYLNETANEVHVRCWHPDPKMKFDVTEVSNANDPQLKDSKALGISRRNKLRFHGVRLIASFHLPHLFSAITDYGTEDFRVSQITNKRISNDANNGGNSSKDYESKQKDDQRNMLIDHIDKSITVEQLKKAESHVDSHELREEYDTKKLELMQGKVDIIEELKFENIEDK